MNLLNYSFFINDENQLLLNNVDPYKNYLEKYSIKISQNFKFTDYKDKQDLPKSFWLIYITDVTDKPFIKPQQLKKYDVNGMKSFNHIEIYKLNKNES